MDRKEYLKKWCEDNKEHLKKYKKKWYIKNIDLCKKRTKDWRIANVEHLKRYLEINKDRRSMSRKEYYSNHKDREIKYNKNYIKEHSSLVKVWREKSGKLWKINNPEKIQAQRAVSHAKTKGILIPINCYICGEVKTEAHHHKGYAKEHWLDVIWLCHICHMKEHRKNIYVTKQVSDLA